MQRRRNCGSTVEIREKTSNMEERFDTGIWYFYPEDRYLYFKGMLGDAHNSKDDALGTIGRQIADDVLNGVVEKTKSDGMVVLYFIGHIIPRENNSTLIDMNTYVSADYGDEIIEILRDYDSYQRINLHVV